MTSLTSPSGPKPALNRIKWSEVARYGLMSLLALVFLFPIVFMVMSSFKPDLDLLRDALSLRAFLPVGHISLDNYQLAFERAPVPLFIFNSMLVTGVTVVLGLGVNSLAGFALAIPRWRGRGLVLTVIIATLIVPFETIAIPLLLIVNKLPWIGPDGFFQGWLNSYHVQIIPFVANAFSIFLFVQFFKGLPGELIEAARIDGAGWGHIYWSLILPLSGPVIATVTVLTFLPMWNSFLWPLMVIQQEKFRPVMVGLQYFTQTAIGGHTAWGAIMAYLSMITIPVLILFLSLQRVFVESIASTGIKG